MLTTILVCILAGLGAGLGTGFAGMSAAAVISPMLITFLGMEPYQAIGIALASDVLASAISAWEYHKNKNLDIKNGLVMMITVMIFTAIASFLSRFISGNTMGGFSTVMTMLLGIKFIVRPVMTTKEKMMSVDQKTRIIQSILCGTIIGLICGFVGAGGGMMMLLILTSVLGYELRLYHDLYCTDRRRQSFLSRRYAGSAGSCTLHAQHTVLRTRCSCFCQQSFRKDIKPGARRCAYRAWRGDHPGKAVLAKSDGIISDRVYSARLTSL